VRPRAVSAILIVVLCLGFSVTACGVSQTTDHSAATSRSVTSTMVAPGKSAPEVSSPPVSQTTTTSPDISSMEFGERAYSYVQKLAVANRPAGTEVEAAAAAKVMGWYEDLGYSPTLQSFTYADEDGEVRTSQNVVVFREGGEAGEASVRPLVIVGAHYDSNGYGLGADDNASGTSVVLEVAERLEDHDLPYDIVFVAFGAEELGGEGSAYFVSQMSAEDVSRTTVMINFDALIFGDHLYVHSGTNGKTGPRDRMLELAEEHLLPIEPGGWPPTGVIPAGYSDHHFFNEAGMPIVFCLATNWEIGEHDGRTQTVEYGTIWADETDTLAIIEQRFPGRPLAHLRVYTKLAFEYLSHL
jgi:alkaline phosphatase isozyme conversion protein